MDPNMDTELFGPSEVIIVDDEGFVASTNGLHDDSDSIEHFKNAIYSVFVQKSRNIKASDSTENRMGKILAQKSTNVKLKKTASVNVDINVKLEEPIASLKVATNVIDENVVHNIDEESGNIQDLDEETEGEDWEAIGAVALRTRSSNPQNIVIIDDDDNAHGKEDEDEHNDEFEDGFQDEDEDEESQKREDKRLAKNKRSRERFANMTRERKDTINKRVRDKRSNRTQEEKDMDAVAYQEKRDNQTEAEKDAIKERGRELYRNMDPDKKATRKQRKAVATQRPEYKTRRNERDREAYANLTPEAKAEVNERHREQYATMHPTAKQWRYDLKHAREVETRANWSEEQEEKYRQTYKMHNHTRAAEKLEASSVGSKNPLKLPETAVELVASCTVLNSLPPEAISTVTTTIDAVGISGIICGRKSWKITAEQHGEMTEDNRIILAKFIRDFVAPVPVIGIESVVWQNREAWQALPWAYVDGNDGYEMPNGENWNEDADARFCQFFETRPANTTVIVLIRGVDGASINPDSWMGLQNRFPTLSITLAFTCSEAYARFRLPAGHDFAYITQPYDERVYCFFTVSGLIGHVNRTAPNAKYNWLLSEWRQGRVARQALSLALQTGDRG